MLKNNKFQIFNIQNNQNASEKNQKNRKVIPEKVLDDDLLSGYELKNPYSIRGAKKHNTLIQEDMFRKTDDFESPDYIINKRQTKKKQLSYTKCQENSERSPTVSSARTIKTIINNSAAATVYKIDDSAK